MKRFTIFLILLALLAGNGWGATYYVDPTVSADTGSGTISDPWKMLTAHTSSLATSDNVYFKAGTTISENSISWPVSGTSDDYCVISRYGIGDAPAFSLASNQARQFYFNNKNYINISGLKFTGGQTGTASRLLYVNDSHHVNIYDNVFDSFICFQAIQVLCDSSGDAHNISIYNNTFSNGTEGVRYNIIDSAHNIYDSDVTSNTFTMLSSSAIRIYSTEALVGASGNIPYGIDFNGNIIDSCLAAINISPGMRTTLGHTSYIRNNICTNIGSNSSPNINALQLCRLTGGVIVEKNIVGTVLTSVPDGNGIMLDWAFTNNSYICDGVIVRYNTVYGCNAGTLVKGISVYKATNCQISYNVVYDCANGYGIANSISTGNVFYNNVSLNCTISGFLARTACAASTLKNNIFYGSQYGIYLQNTSDSPTMPTETYNCFYSNSSYKIYNGVSSTEVAIASTSIAANPQFRSTTDFHLRSSSPCINAGTTISGLYTDFDGKAIKGATDIGAYEYQNYGPFKSGFPDDYPFSPIFQEAINQ